MLKKSMAVFLLFLLVSCSVPPAPDVTNTPALPVTSTPVSEPTIDPADIPYLPNPRLAARGEQSGCEPGQHPDHDLCERLFLQDPSPGFIHQCS
jgi:hypothetical protein